MPSSDSFLRRVVTQSGPADRFAAITPSNTVDLPFTTAAIYVGVTGDISVVDSVSGNNVTFVAVPVGSILPIATNRVRSSGTSAQNLVALG